MALTLAQRKTSNAYEQIFTKVAVAKEISNFRFQSELNYGESLDRIGLSFSSVFARPTVDGSAKTFDTITDSRETWTVNVQQEVSVILPANRKIQTGPLGIEEFIGKELGKIITLDFDARVLNQVTNATYAFDAGDLTSTASNGTPITPSSTTVPQMSAQMPAKLSSKNQMIGDMVFVCDSYFLSSIEQYLQGKNINLAADVFANGYAGGKFAQAKVYISENLTGETVVTMGTNPSDGQVVVVGGIPLTAKSTLGSTAGNFKIGVDVDTTRATLGAFINDPETTSSTQVALAESDYNNLQYNLRVTATNDNTANTLTLVGIGAGVLTVTTDVTSATVSQMTHMLYGKKGAIDTVLQKDMLIENVKRSDGAGQSIWATYLGGIKLFNDSKEKLLDVKVAR